MLDYVTSDPETLQNIELHESESKIYGPFIYVNLSDSFSYQNKPHTDIIQQHSLRRMCRVSNANLIATK